MGLLILILDSKTAILGATEGIDLCIRTVLPSLLPFFPLSILLTASLTGRKLRILQPVGRLLSMPKGSEGILAVGLLGGYPAGALSVRQCFDARQISKQEAHRLLGFCSNAGPGFIFGIVGSMFASSLCAWVLWIIHIASALLTALLIPGSSHSTTAIPAGNMDLPGAVKKSIGILASVCTWIILFRVILAFGNRWILWLFPETVSIGISGMLELTNGLYLLKTVEKECIRFLLCALFLGFGGLCVGMQTVSVTGELGTGWYFPGKLMQSVISVALAGMASTLLFPEEISSTAKILLLFAGIIAAVLPIFLRIIREKKAVAFSQKFVYNKRN